MFEFYPYALTQIGTSPKYMVGQVTGNACIFFGLKNINWFIIVGVWVYSHGDR